jgi:rhamnogalacturonyl hydrolase YesR
VEPRAIPVVRAALGRAARRPPADPTQVNAGPIWLAALELDAIEPDEALRRAALARAGRIERSARCMGVVSHLAWPRSVWSDTPYMAAPLLARAAVETGSALMARRAVHEVMAHMDILADGRGLALHILCPGTGWLDDRVAWARGNGWLLASAVDVIRILGPAECGGLVGMAAALAGEMARRQHPCGLWPVLLDEPGSALESSSAALFAAAALGMRATGIADGPVVQAGLAAARAVSGCIDGRGLARRSQGPVIRAAATPVGGAWPWTQGLALLAAAAYELDPCGRRL